MKKLASIFLATIIFFSCKKDDLPTVVTYEATTTKGGFSVVNYTDEKGAAITVVNKPALTWKITFKPIGPRPQVLYLGAISNLYSVADVDITLKIYINGVVVATTTDRQSAFVTHALN